VYRCWYTGVEKSIQSIFRNKQVQAAMFKGRNADDPTSIASSAAFETLNEACGGKIDKDTLLVQVAGDGVRITEDGKIGAAVFTVRIEELHPSLANTACTVEPFLITGSGKEPTDTNNLLRAAVLKLNEHAPVASTSAFHPMRH
jgi:hypothetical protein